ncbi:MAG: DUF192 domain-containing protein [Myxococcota bacterium]
MVAWLWVACNASGLEVVELDLGGTEVRAEVASDDASRQRGLMFRDSLGTDKGMLFVYPDLKVRHFWMKDTRIPLSIAFADRSGTIVSIADMEPFDTDRTGSVVPAMYALEMTQGWFTEHGVAKGTKIGGIPTDLVVK